MRQVSFTKKFTGNRKKNMEVILAKTAGFCFGVKRAVRTVEATIQDNPNSRIFTYGPIIHNKDVIRSFEEQGVFAVNSFEELDEKLNDPADEKDVILIIRAHGVPEEVMKQAECRGIRVVDATCPFVKKIHDIAAYESAKGRTIVVVGDADHPEIKGICGWVKGPFFVVGTKEEAEALPEFGKTPVTVVFQTTFDTLIYKDFVEIINKKGYDVSTMNTICSATNDRQNEAGLISRTVDVMLVVGDKLSANTNRLYSICKEYCEDTYYIQNTDDLEQINLQSGISVGISAGASTPENIIQEVFSNVRRKKL